MKNKYEIKQNINKSVQMWIWGFMMIAFILINGKSNAQTCPNLLTNGNFESPSLPTNTNLFPSTIPGWFATEPTFEIWNGIVQANFSPYSGSQFLELNAFQCGAIWQSFSIPISTTGSEFSYSFWHRGRNGNDGVEVLIGGDLNNLVSMGNYETNPSQWVNYTGHFCVDPGQISDIIMFKCSSPQGSAGNFLDSIVVKCCPLLSIQSTITYEDACKGCATLTVTGGCPGASYFWSNGSTNATINACQLDPGTYTFTATDDCGKSVSETILISPPIINIAFGTYNNHDDTCCSDILITGGTGDFTQTWNTNPVATTKNICSPQYSNGLYQVTVTDLIGCTATSSFLLDCHVCIDTCQFWAVGGNNKFNGGQISEWNNTQNILGINDNGLDGIKLPPNPISNPSPLRVFTDSKEQMRILSTGQVGIGTTSPIRNLSVNAGMNIDHAELDEGTYGDLPYGLSFGGVSGPSGIGIGASFKLNSDNIYGLNFYTSYNKQMVISSLGNVGIGITTPIHALEVRTAHNDRAGSFKNLKSNTNIGIVGTSGNGDFFARQNNYHHVGVVGLASDNKLFLPADMNIGVSGLADGAYYNIGGYFQAKPTAIRYPVRNWAGYFQGNLNIQGLGFLYRVAIISDSSLKNNVNIVTNALATINLLHPKTYNFKINDYPNLNLPPENQIGFIAQEVGTVLPNLVDSVNYFEERDSLGNIVTPAYSFLSLNYNGFVPIAIAGIKELDTKVNNLAASSVKIGCPLTLNRLPKQSTGDSVCNSQIYDDGIGVGIGTDTVPVGYKCVVEGKFGCRDLIVACAPSWPDYVFESTHLLKPLDDLENYVTVNKHLPGIPSAIEIEKSGINVGEMQTKQMEKIEELFQYVIQMNKNVQRLSAENKQLKERMKNMENK